MGTLKVEIPDKMEEEIESWGVDVQPLFLAFLKQEFSKIEKFSKLVKQSKDESELKKLADEMDEEVLWVLANKILSKSKLTDKKANELAEELKERVARRHEL